MVYLKDVFHRLKLACYWSNWLSHNEIITLVSQNHQSSRWLLEGDSDCCSYQNVRVFEFCLEITQYCPIGLKQCLNLRKFLCHLKATSLQPSNWYCRNKLSLVTWCTRRIPLLYITVQLFRFLWWCVVSSIDMSVVWFHLLFVILPAPRHFKIWLGAYDVVKLTLCETHILGCVNPLSA